ncbi:WD40-repeat-containing domain protein [Cladochytrium replicatum]|nr:WD40-repeat-containing domain protein [Cladochytrium replicatum]
MKLESELEKSSTGDGDFGPAAPPADASQMRLERSVNTLVLEEDEFGPAPPSLRNESDDGSDDITDDGEDKEDVLPFTHEIKLMDHTRAVCAIGLDPAGSRMVASGRDCFVKMWDFAGMDSSLRPFRSFELSGGNSIHEMNFSLTGETFMIASAELVPELFHRDGNQIAEFAKGDLYIRDRRHTQFGLFTSHGHVAALSTIKWHPSDKQTFLTAAADSTDIEDKLAQKSVIVVKSKIKGGVTPIYSANFSHYGKLIAAGNQRYIIFKRRRWCDQVVESRWAVHQSHLLSLTVHGSVKLWDIRNFRAPATSLPTSFEENNLNDASRSKSANFETADKKAAGIGFVHMLYDPNVSINGAKLCAVKEPKRRQAEEVAMLVRFDARSIVSADPEDEEE